MIPKKIHFCWYGGGEYTETIKKCIRSWEKYLPDYEIIRWDEKNTPFDKMPFLRILYKQKRWAFISDYMRLYALYKQGGVYFDTDIEVIKSFDFLLEEKAFIAFQTNFGESKYPFNTAVIGGEKGSSFIECCLKETEKLQRMNYHAMAAPTISTKILLKKYGVKNYACQKLSDVTVLTREYFYPFAWFEKFTPACIQPTTIAIHWWEDSWGNKQKNAKYYWISFSRKVQRTHDIIRSRVLFLFKKSSDYYLYKK